MKILDLTVETRDKLGSAEARRYRRAGRIPCILYGGPQENVTLTTTHDQFDEILKAHTLLVRLHLASEEQTALVRRVEWNTFGEYVEHVDFQRVEPHQEVSLAIPLRYVGTPAGTAEGGRFERELDALPVRGPLESMPAELRIDTSHLDVGDSLRASEVELPAGIVLDCDEDDMIAHVRVPKVVVAEPVEGEEGAAAAEGAPAAAGDEDEDEDKDKES